MNLNGYPSFLIAGRSVEFLARGSSMEPLIHNGEMVHVEPVKHRELEVGDIVLARVRGRLYLHKISAIHPGGRVQISNYKGRVSGWTTIDKVYGKVLPKRQRGGV